MTTNGYCPRCGGMVFEEQEEWGPELWCMACGWRSGRRRAQGGEAPKWRRGPEPDRRRLRKRKRGAVA